MSGKRTEAPEEWDSTMSINDHPDFRDPTPAPPAGPGLGEEEIRRTVETILAECGPPAPWADRDDDGHPSEPHRCECSCHETLDRLCPEHGRQVRQ